MTTRFHLPSVLGVPQRNRVRTGRKASKLSRECASSKAAVYRLPSSHYVTAIKHLHPAHQTPAPARDLITCYIRQASWFASDKSQLLLFRLLCVQIKQFLFLDVIKSLLPCAVQSLQDAKTMICWKWLMEGHRGYVPVLRPSQNNTYLRLRYVK